MSSFGRTTITDLALTGSLTLGGNKVTEISNDVAMTANSDSLLPTQRSVKTFVENAMTDAGLGDMQKSVYDPTNINASAFNMENMLDGITKKIFTAEEKTKLSTITTFGMSLVDKNNTSDVLDVLGFSTIGKNISSLANPSGVSYIRSTSTGTVTTAATSTVRSDLSINNVDNTSDANKPISTATRTALNEKQDTLVSGTNIKTINGTTILGSGDISITGAVTSVAGRVGDVVLSKDDVGLGNVDDVGTSYDPMSFRIPVSNSSAYINPNWVPKSLEPSQALENVSASTGLIIPNDTEYVFTPQMSREFNVFIPEVMTAEMQVYREGVYGIYLTMDKKLRINYGGVYETIDSINVSNDWADIQFSYNDNGSSSVTFDVNVNGTAFGVQQVTSYSDEYIRNMFGDDAGFFWLASLGYSSLLNTGINKTQQYGDPVGLQYDLSANGINGSQSTAAARPLIARMPKGGIKTLLQNSIWSSGPWITGSSIAPLISIAGGVMKLVAGVDFSTTSGGFGRSGVSVRQQLTNPSAATGDSRALSIKVKVLEGFAYVGFGGSDANSSRGTGLFLDKEGNVTEVSRASNTVRVLSTATHLGDGVYLVKISGTPNNAANALVNIHVGASSTNEPNLDCSGPFNVEFEAPMANDGVEALLYQRSVSARDVTQSGSPDVSYLYFDGADDVHTRTIPEITNGTIIVAGPNGIWIDTINAAAGAFATGPSTYTGGPAGLINLLGGLIGCVLINRALTEPERAQIVAMFTARGAGPVLEELS